jgi:hypothetical protein
VAISALEGVIAQETALERRGELDADEGAVAIS